MARSIPRNTQNAFNALATAHLDTVAHRVGDREWVAWSEFGVGVDISISQEHHSSFMVAFQFEAPELLTSHLCSSSGKYNFYDGGHGSAPQKVMEALCRHMAAFKPARIPEVDFNRPLVSRTHEMLMWARVHLNAADTEAALPDADEHAIWMHRYDARRFMKMAQYADCDPEIAAAGLRRMAQSDAFMEVLGQAGRKVRERATK